MECFLPAGPGYNEDEPGGKRCLVPLSRGLYREVVETEILR